MNQMNEPKIRTASFHTLGCRVNQYETRAITEEFMGAGFEIKEFGKQCDICLINTCAVTAESERKSAQTIRRAAKSARVVMVVGCFSEYKPELAASQPNVRYVGGAKDKSALVNKALTLLGETIETEKEIYGIGNFPDSKIRGFVKIEDGCNGKCSYCIIPKLRGEVVLREKDDIVDEVKRLADNGCREIALTGIEISAHDKLPEIIESISDVYGIERIRLGSLDPRIIDDRFLTAAQNKKFMPHLHISLQSANNRILALMKRPYTKETAAKHIENALEAIPNLLISVDIISSFPTETMQELEETIDFLKRYPISHVHAFPYSPRPGTVAAEMEEFISASEKKERHSFLLNECQKLCKKTLSTLIGTTQEVLVESGKNSVYTGCTENFVEVSFSSEKDIKNKLVKVLIESESNHGLSGKYINNNNQEK